MSGRRVPWWWWFLPVAMTGAALGVAVSIHDLVGIVVWSLFTVSSALLLPVAWSARHQ